MALLLLVISSLIINCSTGCKAIYVNDRFHDVVEPNEPLEVCVAVRNNTVSYSWIPYCDRYGNLFCQYYKGENCEGNYVEYDLAITSDVEEVKCSGKKCDYAVLRFYEAPDKCEPGNDSIDIAYAVNWCVETGQNPFDLSNIYLSTTCTSSSFTQNYHINTDCSDKPTAFHFKYVNGECYDISGFSYYVEVRECSKEKDYPTEIFHLANHYQDLIGGIINTFVHLFVIIIIFSKLYECKLHHVKYKCIPFCCPIDFSDIFTWLIEPTNCNKIYALITPILYMCGEICFVIDVIIGYFVYGEQQWSKLSDWQWFLLDFGIHLFYSIGFIFNTLFLTSTLEYYMGDYEIMTTMISVKFITFVKWMTVLNELSMVVYNILRWYVTDFENSLGSNIWFCIYYIFMIFVQFGLLRLYYRGMNNLCHYWYSKQWKEYDKYGENERIHEILLEMSRVIVAVASFVVAVIITVGMNIPAMILAPLDNDVDYKTEAIMFGFSVFQWIIFRALYIPYALSIYFIYPFGHIFYEKLCNKCHQKIYECLKTKLRHQVDNGGFDGKRYKSKHKNKCLDCCMKSIKSIKNRNVNNMNVILNDDDL